MNKKQIIKINESKMTNLVTRIVNESIDRILAEGKRENLIGKGVNLGGRHNKAKSYVSESKLNKVVSNVVRSVLNEIMMTPAHFGMNKAKDFLSFEDFCKICEKYRMAPETPEEKESAKVMYNHLCNEWDEGDGEGKSFKEYVEQWVLLASDDEYNDGF